MKTAKKTWLFVALLAGMGLASVQAQTQAEVVTPRSDASATGGDELVTLQKSVQVAMQNEHWHSALTHLERLLVLTPRDAFAYGMYGQALQMLYRNHDALGAYRKSTELDPKLAAAWAGLCGVQVFLSQPQYAQVSCEKSIAINPNSFAVFANLGHAMLLQGDAQLAQLSYQKSLLNMSSKFELQELLKDFDQFVGKGWQTETSREAKAWFEIEGSAWLARWEAPNKLRTEANTARLSKDYERSILLTEQFLSQTTELVGSNHFQSKNSRIAINEIRLQWGKELMLQAKHSQALEHFQLALAFWEKESGPKSQQVAVSLSSVAAGLFGLGRYSESLPLCLRALEIVEQVNGPQHPATGHSLLVLARAYSALNREADALPLNQRALAIFEKSSGSEHADTAAGLAALAQVYSDMGRPADALPPSVRALEISEKANGPDHPSTVANMSTLAIHYRTLGRYADALPLSERALAISEKTNGPDHSKTGALARLLAMNHRLAGRFDQALRLNLRALDVAEKADGPESLSSGYALHELGEVYRLMGRYMEALPLVVRALKISEKFGGPGHPESGGSVNLLAYLYESLGRYAEALPLFVSGLAISEKTFGPDSGSTGAALHGLAYLYESMGRYPEAVPLVLRAVAISEKTHGAEHPQTGSHLHLLAELYRAVGRYAEAEPLYLRSLSISEKVNGLSHPDTGTFLNNLGELYRTMGRYADALPVYERALAIAEAANIPDLPFIGTRLSNLALLHVSMGNAHLSEPLYQRAHRIASVVGRPEAAWTVQSRMRSFYAESHPELAILYGKQAVNTLQQVRAGNVSLEKETQRSFLERNDSSYKALADLLITRGRLHEGQQVLAMLKEAEYFDFVQRSSATDPRQTLADYTDHERPWNERYAMVGGKLAALSKEREALLKKARESESSGSVGSLSIDDQKRKEVLDTDLAVARQAFDTFMVDLKREFTQGATAQRQQEFGEKNLGSLRALQGTLRDLGKLSSSSTVLLHYLMTDQRLWILLTTPNIQIKREAAISSAALNRLIGQYRQAIASRDPTINELGKALYDILIGPAVEDLKQEQAQTLMLSLDGSLRYLPMAALYDGNQYLAQRYRLSIYTAAAKDKLKDLPHPSWTLAGYGLTQKIENFDALPSVKGELNGILQDMKGSIKLDQDFTAKSFKTGLESEPAVVHLASHFVFKAGNETDSFLLMGDGKRLSLKEIKDGYEFINLDLLTLSACETAVGGGADANGREVEGFGALAQNQGAKGVIATLWPVADQSTGQFMQLFYGFRQQSVGMTKAHAMQLAQRAFIEGRLEGALAQVSRGAKPVGPSSAPAAVTETTDHPYFWAPFILMGNWL